MVVSISDGQLEGIQENGLHIFKGIPYACPPVKELRFKAPEPVKTMGRYFGCVEVWQNSSTSYTACIPNHGRTVRRLLVFEHMDACLR